MFCFRENFLSVNDEVPSHSIDEFNTCNVYALFEQFESTPGLGVHAYIKYQSQVNTDRTLYDIWEQKSFEFFMKLG